MCRLLVPEPGARVRVGFAGFVDPESSPKPHNDGVFRWAGAANTCFWMDLAAELRGMIWTQLNPFVAYDLEPEFQTLVYEVKATGAVTNAT